MRDSVHTRANDSQASRFVDAATITIRTIIKAEEI